MRCFQLFDPCFKFLPVCRVLLDISCCGEKCIKSEMSDPKHAVLDILSTTTDFHHTDLI